MYGNLGALFFSGWNGDGLVNQTCGSKDLGSEEKGPPAPPEHFLRVDVGSVKFGNRGLQLLYAQNRFVFDGGSGSCTHFLRKRIVKIYLSWKQAIVFIV